MFYRGVRKLFGVVVNLIFNIEVKGIENIPSDGSCIIASNHKSNWDPIILVSILKSREVNGVAKKELFNNPILRAILSKLPVIPVDREKPEISTIKKILKLIKEGEVVAIFPEGTRHKDLNTFADAKSGVGMFVLKGKTSVVPISIVTNYKLFSKVVIYIDKPMIFDEYNGKKVSSEDYTKVSNEIMTQIKVNYFNEKNK